MVATLLQRFLKQYTIAQIMLVLDGIIVLSGMFFFGVKPALYAVVAIFITTEVSDAIMEGIKYSKAAYIITEDAAEVADALMHRMNRGVTAIHAKGMYSGNAIIIGNFILFSKLPPYSSFLLLKYGERNCAGSHPCPK